MQTLIAAYISVLKVLLWLVTGIIIRPGDEVIKFDR